ncbi:MAG: Holliday junction branch migration DNA helicase RuvB [Caldisericia bacterium]|nr:Holliday junction branch migration DNA helicase RuvB [Caldisericia bacterium]MDD4614810.1 Holliday junction branch migration DNA helicase RuvB [Caldisericia bacterium]
MNQKQTPPKSEDYLLRPSRMKDYIGQTGIKQSLKIAMQAAKDRKECLEHILLNGPPGLGKTSLAIVLSNEMERRLVKTTATSIKRIIDLMSLVMTLNPGDILFIDEIHRLDKRIEESFYSVMEDFEIQIVRGGGRNIKAASIPCNPFTLIGATTRAGLLSKPLRDRFGLTYHFQFYSLEELVDVIQNVAHQLKIEIPRFEAIEIAKRSRGTPRIAIHLVKRVRDVATVRSEVNIQMSILDHAFSIMHLDENGLSDQDRKLLLLLYQKHGRPMGLNTICAILSEDRMTLEEITEPYLLLLNFIEKTPRGRVLTKTGIQYLKRNGYVSAYEVEEGFFT